MRQRLIWVGLIGLLVGLGWKVANPQLNRRMENKDVSVEEFLEVLQIKKEVFLVDVHMPEQEHLTETDAVIPFNEIKNRLSEFPEDISVPILVYCRSGSMSAMAAEDLMAAGYRKVYNLNGGMHAWTGAGLPLKWW